MFSKPMSSRHLPFEKLSSAPANLNIKQLIREALRDLADPPVDEEDYIRKSRSWHLD